MRLHFIALAFWFNVYQICYGEKTTNGLSPTPQYLDELLSTFQYDKFIEIMQIPNTDLVNASQRKSTSDEMFYYSGTDLGDILYRPGQLTNPDQLKYLDGTISLSVKKWKDGIIPYYFSKEFAENETQLVENEIDRNNEAYAPVIKIRPYQEGDQDYVFMFKGGCGCFTNLGNVGGPQAISMNSPCIFNGSISHEMTHVLGIPHASNRFDRNDYLTLLQENIPQSMKSQFTRYTPDSPANIGYLDFKSSVMYPANIPGFGFHAFDFNQDGIDRDNVGKRTFVSAEDIKRAKQFYSS